MKKFVAVLSIVLTFGLIANGFPGASGDVEKIRGNYILDASKSQTGECPKYLKVNISNDNKAIFLIDAQTRQLFTQFKAEKVILKNEIKFQQGDADIVSKDLVEEDLRLGWLESAFVSVAGIFVGEASFMLVKQQAMVSQESNPMIIRRLGLNVNGKDLFVERIHASGLLTLSLCQFVKQ